METPVHSRFILFTMYSHCLQLEFWLQLYFALHPVLVGDSHPPVSAMSHSTAHKHADCLECNHNSLVLTMIYHPLCTGRSDNSSLSQTLPAFKQYLDANGPLLANDPQFLSYYALPYVPKPQSHPAFAHIFTPTFVPDLRSQLSNVLRSAPVKPALPRLYSMYAAAEAAGQLPSTAALPSVEESVQHGMGTNQRPLLSSIASRPISRAVHSSSRPLSGAGDRELHGTRRPVSGAAGMGLTGNPLPLSGAAGMGLTGNSRPPSGAAGVGLTGNPLPLSGAAGMGLTGNSRPISGRLQASRRPISALLNGSKELADLVSVSKPRYTDQSAAPSLEPSAEVLHGQYVCCRVHVAPASKHEAMLQQDCFKWFRYSLPHAARCMTNIRICAHAYALLSVTHKSKMLFKYQSSCAVWFAVVHSEGSESGISAEVSLLEADEHGLATEPNVQASATAHAAISPDAVAGSQFISRGISEAAAPSYEVLTRQASSHGNEHPSSLHDAALEAAGHLALIDEGSIAAIVQRGSSAPVSGDKVNAASEARHPLELLAASRSSQSLAASAGSASHPSSLAASAKNSLSGQLPQARHVGSSANGSRKFRPDSAAKAVSRSHSVGGLASSHGSGSDAVDTVDSAQSRPAEEACLPDREFLRQTDGNSAASEPMFGSSQRATVSASSRGPSQVTQGPAQLSCHAVESAEDACIVDSVVDDMCVAASLSRDAPEDGILSDAGNKPACAAAAADVLTPTSSIAARTDTEHRQLARDVPVGQDPMRSSMNSRDKAANLVGALNSTAQKSGHTTTDSATPVRSSGGREVAQASAGGYPVDESSRSSTIEAAGTDHPARSPSLSRTGSTREAFISSHAPPERSISPLLPPAQGTSLSGDQISVMNGQTSVSTDAARESCLRGTPLAAPADQGESLPGASFIASLVKGTDAVGASLPQLGQRAATPVNTSLSQLGKAGGAGVIRHSVILTSLDPLDQWLYRHPSVLASLDYDKVKADLQVCHLSLQHLTQSTVCALW